jgi:hypothetical protein
MSAAANLIANENAAYWFSRVARLQNRQSRIDGH